METLVTLDSDGKQSEKEDVSENKAASDEVSKGMQGLARLLASEEKSVRLEALSKLKVYITTRIEKENYFTFPELKKLWKCLYYCLWICDTMIRQEKLSKSLARLTPLFVKIRQKMNFIKAFFFIIKREWLGLDTHRQDKFLFLIRIMVRSALNAVLAEDLSLTSLKVFSKTMQEEVFSTKTVVSASTVEYHVCDVFFDEVGQILAEKVTHDVFMRLCFPFLDYMKFGKDQQLCYHMTNELFLSLTGLAKYSEKRLLGQNVETISFDRNLFADHVSKLAVDETISDTNRNGLLYLLKRWKRQTLEMNDLEENAKMEKEKRKRKKEKKLRKEQEEIQEEFKKAGLVKDEDEVVADNDQDLKENTCTVVEHGDTRSNELVNVDKNLDQNGKLAEKNKMVEKEKLSKKSKRKIEQKLEEITDLSSPKVANLSGNDEPELVCNNAVIEKTVEKKTEASGVSEKKIDENSLNEIAKSAGKESQKKSDQELTSKNKESQKKKRKEMINDNSEEIAQLREKITSGAVDINTLSAYQIKEVFQEKPVEIKLNKDQRKRVKKQQEKNISNKKRRLIEDEKRKELKKKQKAMAKENADNKMEDQKASAALTSVDFVATPISKELRQAYSKNKSSNSAETRTPKLGADYVKVEQSEKKKKKDNFLTSEEIENLPSFTKRIAENAMNTRTRSAKANKSLGAINLDDEENISGKKIKPEAKAKGRVSFAAPSAETSEISEKNENKNSGFKQRKSAADFF